MGTLVHGGIWRRGLRSCRAAGASEAGGMSSEAPGPWSVSQKVGYVDTLDLDK